MKNFFKQFWSDAKIIAEAPGFFILFFLWVWAGWLRDNGLKLTKPFFTWLAGPKH